MARKSNTPRSSIQFVARPYSKRGRYPKFEVSSHQHFFGELSERLISITPAKRAKSRGDFYSDFDTLLPEEIRLISALLLSVPEEMGTLCIYPNLQISLKFSAPNRVKPQESTEFIERLAEILVAADRAEQAIGLREYDRKNRGDYSYNESANRDLFETVFQGFRTKSDLLLRGMHALIKASMLREHSQFNEEGALSAYIAMEASFQILRREVRAVIGREPEPSEIGRYMRECFDARWGSDDFLSEYYSDRIMVVHPASRFGIFPYAPISYDDFWTLFKILVLVFRWIITSGQLDWNS